MNPIFVRVVTAVLVLLVATPAAYADTLFRRSIDKAVAEEAQAATRRAARDENPHKGAAITLLSAGAGLVLLGFVMPSGAECKETNSSLYGIECGTKANKGLLFAGLGAAGLGGFMYMKGEQQRATPSIMTTAGGVVVRSRVRF